MPQLMQDEAGQYFVDTGGGVLQPVSEDQARTFLGGQGVLAGAGQAAEQGLQNLFTGAGSLLSDDPRWFEENQRGREQSEALNLANPVTSAGAQYAPQVAAGLATGSAGFWPTVGVEAALGAATTPESPVEGAALGAAGGALPFAIGPAARAAGRGAARLQDALPWQRAAEVPDVPGYARPTDLAEGMSAPSAPGAAGAAPSDAVGDLPLGAPQPQPGPAPSTAGTALESPERMSERVYESLRRAEYGPGTTRVQTGQLSPDELVDYGVPTSEGDRMLLTAMNEGGQGRLARAKLEQEQALASHQRFGQGIRDIRDAQRTGTTNFINREIGLPPGVNLTEDALAEQFSTVGGRLDYIAEREMGPLAMTPEVQTGLNEVLTQVTGAHANQLRNIVEELQAMAAQNEGAVSGQQWQQIRTKLSNMIDAGTRQGNFGKISDARSMLDVMTENMEGNLDAGLREELRELRHQYRVLSTLTKAGVRDADGRVNAGAFYRNWKASQSKKTLGKDEVGRFMNTMATLNKTRVPDSGTARRLQAVDTATKAAVGVAAGAAGIGGASSILDKLL